MKNKFIYVALIALTLTNTTFAETPMSKYLSKLKIFENEDGREISTFEDVYINLNPFQERNKKYPMVNESKIPEGYVSKETASKYFKKFNSNPILTEEKMSFKEFMNEHLSIIAEDGLAYIAEFPQEAYFTETGTKTYRLHMDDNYKYVSNFMEYSPDASSCKSNRSLCDSSCENGHKYINNIYSNFKENLLSKSRIVDAEEVNSNKNLIKMSFKRRTPPAINFDGEIFKDKMLESGFGLLCIHPSAEGGSKGWYSCTSSDWTLTNPGIVIGERGDERKGKSNVYFAKFSFGRIGGCPNENEEWMDRETWTNLENIIKIDYNNSVPVGKGRAGVLAERQSDSLSIPYFQDVVKFQNLNALIRYSIFVKQNDINSEEEPVNPSIIVQEDSPETGYGYSAAGDLGNRVDTAQDWPLKESLGHIARKGHSTGLIRVFDNDRPNIIIRITNLDSEEEMFFPPCVASSECRINNSSKYKAISGANKTNKDDYDLFVENLGPDYNHMALIDVPELKPYYTIYQINDFDKNNVEKDTTLGSYIDRLLLNKDPKFINENIRVEDYYFSDTAQDGEKRYKSEGSDYFKGFLGKSKGTFDNMVALFENTGSFRFKTGVEYKLDVWTDDNVKWSNLDLEYEAANAKVSGEESKMVNTPYVYHTGIKKGTIELIHSKDSDDNESKDIDITKHINGDICFTFKDPTPSDCKIKTVRDLEKNDFPSVKVTVEDFAGLKRELRLFFRVNDRNIDIKTLQ